MLCGLWLVLLLLYTSVLRASCYGVLTLLLLISLLGDWPWRVVDLTGAALWVVSLGGCLFAASAVWVLAIGRPPRYSFP